MPLPHLHLSAVLSRSTVLLTNKSWWVGYLGLFFGTSESESYIIPLALVGTSDGNHGPLPSFRVTH